MLAVMLDERGVSLRTLADDLGGVHTHNYWHQRLKPGAGTKMSLEDIETLCAYLGVNPARLVHGGDGAASIRP